MTFEFPRKEELLVQSLGEAKIPSPLSLADHLFIGDGQKVLISAKATDVLAGMSSGSDLPMFEQAGPRQKLFFDPAQTICGIVTCGGLCPGLNDVIRSLSLTALLQYRVKKVLGFRYGYEGLTAKAKAAPLELTPDTVRGIQHEGGTILGSSRGPQDVAEMVDTLLEQGVNVLFVIGGDGTFRGAHDIMLEIERRQVPIAVVGVPKTIDNDIYGCETSFGFGTSVEQARKSIASAHEEATSAFNGIGLVKLMGRNAGFIASCASLANSDVNFCLIPEVPFALDGEDGLLRRIEARLNRRHHAVIVVAEGAGQHLMQMSGQRDASGNVRYGNIGTFLKETIAGYLTQQGLPFTIKYIDPSYTIRSCAANARDSVYCLLLAQMAVHAAMAGKTDMFVGFWNQHFTHVPLEVAVTRSKTVDPNDLIWQTVLAISH